MNSNKYQHREVYGGPEYNKRLRVYMRAYDMQKPGASSLDRQRRSGQQKINGNHHIIHDKGCPKSGISITYQRPTATLEVEANDVVYVSKILVHDTHKVTSEIIFSEPVQPRSRVTRLSRRPSHTVLAHSSSRRGSGLQDSAFEDTESDTTTDEQSSTSSDNNFEASKISSDSFASSSSGSDADETVRKVPLFKISKRKDDHKHSHVSFCEQVRVANFFTDDQSDDSASDDDSLEGNPNSKEWRESIIEHNELLKTDSFCVTWQRSSPVATADVPDCTNGSPEENEPWDKTTPTPDEPSATERQHEGCTPKPQSIPLEARQRVVLTAPFTLIFNVSQVHKEGSPRISARLTPIHPPSKDDARRHTRHKQLSTSSENQQLFRWPSFESKDRMKGDGFWKQQRRSSLQCSYPTSYDNWSKTEHSARRWSTQAANCNGYQLW